MVYAIQILGHPRKKGKKGKKGEKKKKEKKRKERKTKQKTSCTRGRAQAESRGDKVAVCWHNQSKTYHVSR